MISMTRRVVAPGVIALLDPAVESFFPESEQVLRDEVEGCGAFVVMLLPWREPPPLIARDDGPVHSFLCSEPLFERLVAQHPEAAPEDLAYFLMEAILNGKEVVDRLLIRQLPYTSTGAADAGLPRPTALLMAHRGSIDHLRVALLYLSRNAKDGLTIRVGLDTEDAEPYRALASSCDRIEFFRGRPAPAGPYVIRQKLAELSPEPLFLFHDSDDVSCTDRLARMHASIGSDSGLTGCHELLVDETQNEVRAIRYPLDITGALRDGPHYSVLHPTSMVGRGAFFAAGGFSTDRFISQDTQFHFRAWFHMRMRNLDRFLYIRRKHASSLTTAPATKIGSDLRRSIERPWSPDFESIKSGKLTLAESSLVAVQGPLDHELVPFP